MLGPRMSVDADLNTATLLPNADPIFQAAGFGGLEDHPIQEMLNNHGDHKSPKEKGSALSSD